MIVILRGSRNMQKTPESLRIGMQCYHQKHFVSFPGWVEHNG